MAPRPSCSVIVPFAGTDDELEGCLAALTALELRDGDEILVADNRARSVEARRGEIRIVAAPGPASSYFARGVGVRAAQGEWLVFVDADCLPVAGLLDAYFDPPPREGTGVLAGAISGVGDGPTGRHNLDQAVTLLHPRAPYAQTANCAVRRTAYEAVGGFADRVRSGGDADLCWRLQAAGHGLEARGSARVGHRARATRWALLGQLHRHGAGMQWLDRRYRGAFPPPGPRELLGRFRLLLLDPSEFLARWAADLGRLRANGDPS